jgi:hypothetical protein
VLHSGLGRGGDRSGHHLGIQLVSVGVTGETKEAFGDGIPNCLLEPGVGAQVLGEQGRMPVDELLTK